MTDTNAIAQQIEVLQSILDPYKEFLEARDAHEAANVHTIEVDGVEHKVSLVVDVEASDRYEAAAAAYAQKRTYLRQCREYLDAIADADELPAPEGEPVSDEPVNEEN